MEQGEYTFHYEQGDHDWWQVGMRRCTRAVLPRSCAGMRILDCGAGAGFFVRDLRRDGADAQGVEMSPIAAAFAEKLGTKPWIVLGKLQDILPGDRSLHLVSLLDVLPHREVDESGVFDLIARSVVPGGLLLLRLPAYRWLYGAHDVFVHQHRRYNKGDVQSLARAHGFEVARLTFANCVLFPLVAGGRLVEWIRSLVGTASVRSSNRELPPVLNWIFRAALSGEARLIRRGVDLPFGSSIIALLRRV